MLPTCLVIAWSVFPVLVSATVLWVQKTIHPVLVCILCVASIIGGTIILANYVWAIDAQLLAEIEKHAPGTPEAELASEEWASDTGRSFLLLFSPVLTGVCYSGLFLLFLGLRSVRCRVLPTKEPLVSPRTVSDATGQPGDDGNPYQSPAAFSSRSRP
ncbi:MAG: hypothetical protein D6753_04285 [Planctomycetota bacterium]|nr:MAG: hypothetical protein D6753_04285 [Planctomycetota bacterium]